MVGRNARRRQANQNKRNNVSRMGSKISRRRCWTLGLFAALVLLLGFGVLKVVGQTSLKEEFGSRTPGELIRHAKLRLQGHDKLEWLMLGPLNQLQRQYERAVLGIKFPTLGKGQQNRPLSRVRYSSSGQPKDELVERKAATALSSQETPNVATAEELAKAVATAKAGQVIQVAPGRYGINQTLVTKFSGTKDQPITLRASQPGQVTLEFSTVEGITVSQPFWVFENLVIRGICPSSKTVSMLFT